MKQSRPVRFKARAFQVDIARQSETPRTLRRIIDFGASVGYNELFLYGEGALRYSSHPECSYPWALTRDDFLKLQGHAARCGMRIVPVIPVLGHADYILKNRSLEHLREIRKPSDEIFRCDMRQFCLSQKETYVIIEDLLSEWAKITDAPYIHIGGDESWNFATCPECRRTAEKIGRGRLLAGHFNSVNGILRKHGKRSMMWHDMLFYFQDCLPHLDKDIIICDWHYSPIERHPGISIYNWIKTPFMDSYEKEGFTVYLCPKSKFDYNKETDNIKTFVEYCGRRDVAGFLNTVWGMKNMPFASCFPSLAYGAACCRGDSIPDTGEFLQSFAAKHYKGGSELLPFLVDLFSQVAEKSFFSSVRQIINYQDPCPVLNLASRVDESLKVLRQLAPATPFGAMYKEALFLIFKRQSLGLRLAGLLNEVARSFFPHHAMNKKQVAAWLNILGSLARRTPAQIRLEQKVWNKYRPAESGNTIVDQLRAAKREIPEFVQAVARVLGGKLDPTKVFPRALELTIVNNDCSWQCLRVAVSSDGKEYKDIGTFPQCGPFGRYIKTYPLPQTASHVRLELSGLGQILLHYLRIIGPDHTLVPSEILRASGSVVNPEHLLIDDFRPVIFGSLESRGYFSEGRQQPTCVIDVRMEQER